MTHEMHYIRNVLRNYVRYPVAYMRIYDWGSLNMMQRGKDMKIQWSIRYSKAKVNDKTKYSETKGLIVWFTYGHMLAALWVTNRRWLDRIAPICQPVHNLRHSDKWCDSRMYSTRQHASHEWDPVVGLISMIWLETWILKSKIFFTHHKYAVHSLYRVRTCYGFEDRVYNKWIYQSLTVSLHLPACLAFNSQTLGTWKPSSDIASVAVILYGRI